MIATPALLHYTTIAAVAGIAGLGVSIGQGITSRAALQALNQQPQSRAEIMKIVVLALAFIETAAIIGSFIAILLMQNSYQSFQSLHGIYAQLGIVCAICIPSPLLSILSGLPARAACLSVARQPFFSEAILRFMLVSLSFLQSPLIFGFIVSLFIRGQSLEVTTAREAYRLIASGMAIGLGCVGPIIGLAHFARVACTNIGLMRENYRDLLTFTLLSQAIIETPIIFASAIAITLLFIVPRPGNDNILEILVMLSSAFCIGLGTLGTGMSSGATAATACKEISNSPHAYVGLSRLSMFAQGLIETTTIYAVLVALVFLFLLNV